MGQLFFEPEYSSSGTMLRLRDKPLLGRARSVPIEEWPRCMAERAFSGVSKLLALLDDADGNATPELDGVRITHHAIAPLTEPQALGLGLPPSVRQALQIDGRHDLTPASVVAPQQSGQLGDVDGDVPPSSAVQCAAILRRVAS